MTKQVMPLIAASLLALTAACKHADIKPEEGKFEASWESLAAWECPEWFKDAKFGIWAHWGPQCQAEDGDWYARHIYYPTHQQQWHKKYFGDPATTGFMEVIHQWHADEWQPDSLVRLYAECGAKYFFALGQHHDNFDLWDSPFQEWNSVNMGPKKDLLKGWAGAARKYNLPFGISMHGSHTWTWMEGSQDFDGNITKEDGKGKWWEGYDPQELYAQRHEPSKNYEEKGAIHSQWDWGNGASTPSEAYKLKFQNRVLQCINEFNPDMLYFDDTVLPFYGCDSIVGLNILKHYYNHRNNKTGQADVVVMGKILQEMHKRCLLWDVERGVPSRPQSDYWQTCTCIGQWHYSQNVAARNRYKSAATVVRMLVDIVSKNGNLLLSVPIRGNGTIDSLEVKIVKEIGAWMQQNGESIYGTRPWSTFGEGPQAEAITELKAQGFNEGNTRYTADDVRYVQKQQYVYATIMDWPEAGRFTFRALGTSSGTISAVELLGHGKVDFAQTDDGLTVEFANAKCNNIAPVFRVTF